MKLYHLKTCDTCRAARKALPDAQTIEIRDVGIDRDTLVDWFARVGPEVLINRASKTWRDLGDDARAMDPVDLVLAHPTVMKRPVIVTDADIHVGWTAQVRSELL